MTDNETAAAQVNRLGRYFTLEPKLRELLLILLEQAYVIGKKDGAIEAASAIGISLDQAKADLRVIK